MKCISLTCAGNMLRNSRSWKPTESCSAMAAVRMTPCRELWAIRSRAISHISTLPSAFTNFWSCKYKCTESSTTSLHYHPPSQTSGAVSTSVQGHNHISTLPSAFTNFWSCKYKCTGPQPHLYITICLHKLLEL